MLAFIEKADVDSFYGLRKATAIVPGVLLLRLKHLSKAGFIRTAESGGRGKKGLKLTAKGRALLESQWRAEVDEALLEPFDSVLKAFWLTRLMDGQKAGLKLLDHAYDERKKQAKRHRDAGERIKGSANPLQTGYAYLQREAQPARLDTEAVMFKDLAEILGRQRSEW